MPKQYTQIPPNAQQAKIYVPPVVFSDDQVQVLRDFARKQYGLSPDDVEEFIRLEAALDWYNQVAEVLGFLPPVYTRAWVETQIAHEELTTRPRSMRAAA